jgi:hypothetical protein
MKVLGGGGLGVRETVMTQPIMVSRLLRHARQTVSRNSTVHNVYHSRHLALAMALSLLIFDGDDSTYLFLPLTCKTRDSPSPGPHSALSD